MLYTASLVDTPAHASGAERGRTEYLAVLEVIAGVWVTESPNGTECRARACTWLRYQDEGASGLADHFHQARERPWRIPG